MNTSAGLFLLLLGVLLLILVLTQRGRDTLDVLMGRKKAV